MPRREVVTFPGPGGSTISCCILPCGCLVLLLVGLMTGLSLWGYRQLRTAHLLPIGPRTHLAVAVPVALPAPGPSR
jgi:hypothetical protein